MKKLLNTGDFLNLSQYVIRKRNLLSKRGLNTIVKNKGYEDFLREYIDKSEKVPGKEIYSLPISYYNKLKEETNFEEKHNG